MRRTLLFLIFLLFVLHGTSQRYSLVNYTTHNGLVQSSITDIKQDKVGNIWIGTTGGLSVFDGKKFTNYDDRQVLQSIYISSILCDSTGLVWIATGNGLLTYDNRFKVAFKFGDTVQSRISCLITYGGRILFICNNRIYGMNRDHQVKRVYVNDSLENKADLITYDTKGNLWIV